MGNHYFLRLSTESLTIIVYCAEVLYSVSVKSCTCLSSVHGEAQLHDIDCVIGAYLMWVIQSPYANSTSSLQVIPGE